MPEETTAVAKPADPNDWLQGMVDKLQADCLDCIPEEKRRELVMSAFKKLTEPGRVNRGSSSYPNWTETPSRLESIVFDIMEEEIKKRVQGMLASAEWGAEWDESGSDAAGLHGSSLFFDGMEHRAGEEVKRMMAEHGEEILLSFIGRVFQNFLMNMRNSIG